MLTEIKWLINQLVEFMILEILKTIRTYGNDIRNNVTSLAAANLEQANLLAHFYDFMKKTKPQDPKQKKMRFDVLDIVGALVKRREIMYNALEAEYFTGLKNHRRVKDLKY